MAARIEVDKKDFERLVSAMQYAIDRLEPNELDQPDIAVLREYLSQELSEVVAHYENESTGGGDPTCEEITSVIDFICGGQNGQGRHTEDTDGTSD